MDNKQLKKYKEKARDSFKTKKKLFLFSKALENIETFQKSDFDDFCITEKIVELYTTEYWQLLEDTLIGTLSIKDIYNKIIELESKNESLIKVLENEYINSFSKILPEEKFIELITKEKCNYCGISKNRIELLAEKRKLYKKSFRGWSLEIDRLNSNFEYYPDNCVSACYWCNNAKTDEFTPKEFEKVGKIFAEIWKNRLND